MSNKPIMIGGSGSSGTTLLSHLLNSHPDIYCGPELNLLCYRTLYRDFGFFRDFCEELLFGDKTLPMIAISLDNRIITEKDIVQDRPFTTELKEKIDSKQLCRLARDAHGFADFVEKVMTHLLVLEKKRRWAEKSPINCQAIGEFLDAFQDGKYVHIVRDGRDVVLSLAGRNYSIEKALRRWLRDSLVSLPYRTHPRVYEIHYEELVYDPRTALSNLFDFLEEDVDIDVLLMTAREMDDRAKRQHESWGARITDNITGNRVGKWQRISVREKKRLENYFRYTYLSKEASRFLKLDKSYNGNAALKAFGYSVADWNMSPIPQIEIQRKMIKSIIMAITGRPIAFTTAPYRYGVVNH